MNDKDAQKYLKWTLLKKLKGMEGWPVGDEKPCAINDKIYIIIIHIWVKTAFKMFI